MSISKRDGFVAMLTVLFLCFFLIVGEVGISDTTDAIRGYIPKFWTNETLNNSLISEQNNTIFINGSLYIENNLTITHNLSISGYFHVITDAHGVAGNTCVIIGGIGNETYC
jgi:hypothetical protein